MSVVHDERAALSAEPRPRYRTVAQRLMIICPTTGRPAATGFELSAVPNASVRCQLLVDCQECGQDHEWRIDDVFLS